MKRLLMLIIAGLSLLIVGYGCNGPGTSTQKNGDGSRDARPIPPPKGEWPFFSEEAETSQVAEKLTTKNIVLIFDGSGSMQDRKCSGKNAKIVVAKRAVKEWCKSVPEDANLGLVAFHAEKYSELPLGRGNREEFTTAIDTVIANGGTPLTESFGKAYKMLTAQAQKQLGYGDYSVVVVTDGKASYPETLKKAVNWILQYTPIMVHTIGFCIDEKHTLNQPGRTMYRTADNPEALREGLQEVLAEAESFDVTGFTQ